LRLSRSTISCWITRKAPDLVREFQEGSQEEERDMSSVHHSKCQPQRVDGHKLENEACAALLPQRRAVLSATIETRDQRERREADSRHEIKEDPAGLSRAVIEQQRKCVKQQPGRLRHVTLGNV
jgi:hypothetical protein